MLNIKIIYSPRLPLRALTCMAHEARKEGGETFSQNSKIQEPHNVHLISFFSLALSSLPYLPSSGILAITIDSLCYCRRYCVFANRTWNKFFELSLLLLLLSIHSHIITHIHTHEMAVARSTTAGTGRGNELGMSMYDKHTRPYEKYGHVSQVYVLECEWEKAKTKQRIKQ